MAKPTQLPEWASGAGAVVAPEPSPGKKAAGFADGERPPYQWFNWWMRRVHQWTQYLDALHNEAEFLNKPYNWTANHSYGPGTNMRFLGTGGDRFVIDAGNVRLDSGGVQATGFLTSPLGLRYSATTPPTRIVMVPLAYAGNTDGWLSISGGLLSRFSNAPVEIPLTHFLRTGSRVTRIRLAYKCAAFTNNEPSFALVRKVADKTRPGIGEQTDLAEVRGSGSSVAQVMSTGILASTEPADLATEEWFVRLFSSGNSGGDIVYWMEARIADFGARNH